MRILKERQSEMLRVLHDHKNEFIPFTQLLSEISINSRQQAFQIREALQKQGLIKVKRDDRGRIYVKGLL